jgi:LysM repeat protein
MRYGIEEIAEFKAPNKKPWLIVAAVAVLGIVLWQGIRFFSGRESSPDVPVVRESPASYPADSIKPAQSVEAPVVKPTSKLPPPEIKAPVPAVAPVAEIKPPAPSTPPVPPPVSNPAAGLKAEPASAAVADDGRSLDEAVKLVTKGDRVGARGLLLGMLDNAGLSEEKRAEIERMLAEINTALALSPYDMPEKVDHVVERGESLDKIAKKYGVTVESIKVGNGVKNPDLIKAGDHLRILDADFSIQVYKEKHELVLLLNGRFFKRYKVGLGKFDKTPLGTFEIYDRIAKPVWWRPDGREIPFGDKENILGTHWMAIRPTGDTPPVKGYGIHGTWDDASIGKSESAGCVRMHNADVEELFGFVPLGTKVTILK